MIAGRIARLASGRIVIVNMGFALAVKGFSVGYSVLAIGLAARALGQDELSSLLLGLNFLVPLGIIQVGLGTLIFREVSRAHAAGLPLRSVTHIASSFRVVGMLAIIAGVGCVAVFPHLDMGFLIPAALFFLLGVVCSLADQIRSARERSWFSNVVTAATYVAFLAVLGAYRYLSPDMNLSVVAFLCYAAPAAASLTSLLLLLREEDFRAALARRDGGSMLHLIRPSVPIILFSLAASALLNIPLSHKWFAWYPRLSDDDIALFRICIVAVNMLSFVIMPALATLLRIRGGGSPAAFRRALLLYVGGFSVCCNMLAAIVGFGGPVLSELWLSRTLASPSVSHGWALVLLLWGLGSVFMQYHLMTRDVTRMAAFFWGVNLLILASPLLLPPGWQVVPATMIAGLAVYMAGSAVWLAADARTRANA